MGRICGLLTAKGRIPEWEKALEHISIHLGSSACKTVNSKFADTRTDCYISKPARTFQDLLTWQKAHHFVLAV